MRRADKRGGHTGKQPRLTVLPSATPVATIKAGLRAFDRLCRKSAVLPAHLPRFPQWPLSGHAALKLQSITVAGAAPEWLDQERTGFPFNARSKIRRTLTEEIDAHLKALGRQRQEKVRRMNMSRAHAHNLVSGAVRGLVWAGAAVYLMPEETCSGFPAVC